jgi:hypothetical protein
MDFLSVRAWFFLPACVTGKCHATSRPLRFINYGQEPKLSGKFLEALEELEEKEGCHV